MVDVVRVGDVGAGQRDHFTQPTRRLGGVNGGGSPRELGHRRTGTTAGIADEMAGPGRGQIGSVMHGKRHHLPTGVLEQSVVLEEDGLGAATPVIVIINRQQPRHS